MMDAGAGPPVIVIPGIQGRWEWMEPALRLLQRTCRVVSYTLCGDAGSGLTIDPARGFDNYLGQLDAIFERTGLERAALCGVSYGGFIALRYAALRPERVAALILVSAPDPGWVPSASQRRYLAYPRLLSPLFVLGAPLRLWPEIRSAFPSLKARIGFAASHIARIAAAPLIPALAAGRIAAQQAVDFSSDPARVRAPALIVTGEDALDRVVPPAVSRSYLRTIPGAEYARLEQTGHIGIVSRPDRFAQIVSDFVHAHSQ